MPLFDTSNSGPGKPSQTDMPGLLPFSTPMALSLHRNRVRSPAFADWADYDVMQDGMVVGRIYEDRYTSADYRWFWSITAFHVDPAFEITTNNRVPTLEQAKVEFREAWSKVSEATKQKGQRL